MRLDIQDEVADLLTFGLHLEVVSDQLAGDAVRRHRFWQWERLEISFSA